ncbi:hypothetical protein [Streptomyces sp. NPDC093591]|uniref:hypothetical protein n=1 Tax=Streptomyces sp. NPDC093591 TaxID=3366044 RepID=UPI00381D8F85
MDQIAPELLMALAGGTAGAAGGVLVRHRPSGRALSGEGELAALDAAADDAERARELAELLARRAGQDPAFAQALETWRHRAQAWDDGRTGAGDVHNEISGGDVPGARRPGTGH